MLHVESNNLPYVLQTAGAAAGLFFPHTVSARPSLYWEETGKETVTMKSFLVPSLQVTMHSRTSVTIPASESQVALFHSIWRVPKNNFSDEYI